MKRKSTVLFLLLLIIFLITRSPEVLAAGSATFSLSPVSGNFTTGQTFDVAVNLNTGGAEVVGVDLILLFDQTKLQVVEVINGSIFQQYLGESINNVNGIYQISALSSTAQNLFSGTGTVITLRFKVYSPGTAEVIFDFSEGSTVDSNVAEYTTQTDYLIGVTNAKYNLSGASVPGSEGVPPSGTTTGTGGTTTTGGTGGTKTGGKTGIGGIGGATGSASLTATTIATKAVPVTATNFPTLALIAFGISFIFVGYFARWKLFK